MANTFLSNISKKNSLPKNTLQANSLNVSNASNNLTKALSKNNTKVPLNNGINNAAPKSAFSKLSNTFKSSTSSLKNTLGSTKNSLKNTIKGAKPALSSAVDKLGDSKLSNLKSGVKSGIKGSYSKVKEYVKSGNTIVQVIIIIIVCILVFVVMHYIKKIIMGLYEDKINEPWLIKGTRNGKNALVLVQDPKDSNAVTLYRSSGQTGGLEFTYTFWMCIMDFKYNFGKWKHVFHKGNKTGEPNKCPGVFIHPTKNALRVYMNTYDKINEYVDIENIPVRKWIHLSIVVKQKTLSIYFNGKLKELVEFNSLPKQNFGDVWINLNGGFDGYISNLRYYRRSLSYEDIEGIVAGGPSGNVCGDTGELPPYLDNNWWYQV